MIETRTELEALVDSEGALLATVLDQSHDCIKLLSLDGIIRYVNRQGAQAMELTSPAALIGNLIWRAGLTTSDLSSKRRLPQPAMVNLVDSALAARGPMERQAGGTLLSARFVPRPRRLPISLRSPVT